MVAKSSLTSVAASHVQTLRDARTNRPSVPDALLQYGLPLAATVAVAVTTWKFHWRMPSTSSLIAGVAILTGLLFGVSTFVFQLRLSITQDPRTAGQQSMKSRIDELFGNVLYAILVGLLDTAALVLADTIRSDKQPVMWGWMIPCTALTVHLVVVLAMCVKRLQGAYRALAS